MKRLLVSSGLLVVGCAEGLDPDIDPVTEGDWVRPTTDTTWQWQLSGPIDTDHDVDLYDVDLFDTSTDTIATLQADGRMVVCYFSAGSSEDWRPDDDAFEPRDRGRRLDGWSGERWLDVRSRNVLQIMLARLDLAVDKGCDGVEPDNMDAFTNRSGFLLTEDDQLGYNRRIANEAHERGLSVALKNDGDQAGALVDYFDFSLNEECHHYGECDQLTPFLDADKPILNAEYPGTQQAAAAARDDLCPKAEAAGTRTLLLPLDLDDSFRIACD